MNTLQALTTFFISFVGSLKTTLIILSVAATSASLEKASISPSPNSIIVRNLAESPAFAAFEDLRSEAGLGFLSLKSKEKAKILIAKSSKNLLLKFQKPSTHLSRVVRSQVTIEESPMIQKLEKLVQKARDEEKFKPYKKTSFLKGQIRMSGGLAYTGLDDELQVFRWSNNQKMESAYISYEEGSFEIEVEKPKGYILAELRDKHGNLLGSGRQSLYESDLDKIFIEITPVLNNSQPQFLSSRSFGSNKRKVAGVQAFVDKLNIQLMIAGNKNNFKSKRLAKGSSYIARTIAEDHWGSLSVGITGEDSLVRIYPSNYIEGQLSIMQKTSRSAVIFGRVIDSKGLPVGGAKVELAGEDEVSPVYFNEIHFPQIDAKTTSKNGFFAFMNVAPGLHAVRASFDQSFLSAQIIPAEIGLVSYLEVEAVKPRTAQVIIYDGLSRKSKPAHVQVYGTEGVHSLSGVGHESLEFPGSKGLMLIDTQSDDSYVEATHSVHRKTKFLLLPLVKKDWLKGITGNNELSVVVGFVDRTDYLVHLAGEKDYKVIYFDSMGRISENSVEAGGFIILGAPLGLNTLAIEFENEELRTHLCFVQQNSASIVTFTD